MYLFFYAFVAFILMTIKSVGFILHYFDFLLPPAYRGKRLFLQSETF